jgi:hypothetical protein
MSTTQRTEIEFLLEKLEAARRRIYLAQAFGVRQAGLRDLKDDVRTVKQRLSAELSV